MIFSASYFVPGVVLSVAVSSGRGLVVSLGINSSLQILNKDPEYGLLKKKKASYVNPRVQDVLIT